MTSSVVSNHTSERGLAVVTGASSGIGLELARLREELKDSGVSITVLQPGRTDTNFFERSGAAAQNTKVAAGKKDDPAELAKDGFEALMAGKGHVVGGSFKNQLQDTMAQVLPETTKAAMHTKQSKPGSARE